MQTDNPPVHEEVPQSPTDISEKVWQRRFGDPLKRSEALMIKLTGVIAITSVIALIIFAFQGYFMRRQADIMEGQLKIMVAGGDQTDRLITATESEATTAANSLTELKNSTKAELRAWINWQGFHYDPKANQAILTFTNSGKTIAQNVVFHFRAVGRRGSHAIDYALAQLSPGADSDDIGIEMKGYRVTEPMSLLFSVDYWDGYEQTSSIETNYRFIPGKGWNASAQVQKPKTKK